MSKQLIVFGDDHIRQEEPFYSAKKAFFEWALDQEWNNSDNIMLHVGDLFHKNLPTPKEYDLASWFLHNCQFDRIILIPGNGIHEFSRAKRSYAIDALDSIDRVSIYHRPDIVKLEKLQIMLLPWIPNNYYDDIPNMKEYYENELPFEFDDMEFDYIFGHFDMGMFADGINMDKWKGKKRMGHIHIPDEQYVGANTIGRKDEKGKTFYLNSIDLSTGEETKIKIPRFMDYVDRTYPEMPTDDWYRIYDIYDAPSEEVVREKYAGMHIHTIHLKSEKQSENADTNSVEDALTLEDHMRNFIVEKNIDATLGKKLLLLIREV